MKKNDSNLTTNNKTREKFSQVWEDKDSLCFKVVEDVTIPLVVLGDTATEQAQRTGHLRNCFLGNSELWG